MGINYILNPSVCIEPELSFLPIWLIIILFVVCCGGGCIIALNVCKTSGYNLTVLGMSMSGKSTLYQMLMRGYADKEYTPTHIDYIESFCIKVGERTIKINKGVNYGGREEFIRNFYEDQIKKNDIIVFIFDANEYLINAESYQQNTNAMLDFVYEKVKLYNKLMSNVVVIASHLDKVEDPKYSSAKIYKFLSERPFSEMIKENFFSVNLLNKASIDELVKKIFL